MENNLLNPLNYNNLNEFVSTTIIRNTFIGKIFGLLSIQLCIITLILSLFITNTYIRNFILGSNNKLLYIIFIVLIVGILLFLRRIRNICKRKPYNYIAFCLFTLILSCLLGLITVQYNLLSVIYSSGMIMGICFALMLYSYYLLNDFTICGGLLVNILIILCIGTFFGIFVKNETNNILISVVSSFLISLYLIYDIHLVTNGSNKRNQLEYNECIFASINIYYNIINLISDFFNIFYRK